MKTVDVVLVNSFIKNGGGGNPAGVVLHADNLSNTDKLKVAQAVGYSETAFLSADDEVDCELTFFTVAGEVDFCGHATLAAFSMLFQAGVLPEGTYTQRTKAGLLGVVIEPNGHVIMEQRLPEYLGSFRSKDIAELIGIDSSVLDSTHLPIEVVSTGLPDIIVPVPFGYLDKIKINEELTNEFCRRFSVVGIHAFELYDQYSELTASCRNFAPLHGISEEAATGSSSGALACHLTKHLGGTCSNDFTFEQGRAMGCISRITASVMSNELGIVRVQVGGFAHKTGKQIVSI